MSDYCTRRAALIELIPALGAVLPEAEPPAPSIAPQSQADRERRLRAAGTTHHGTVLVLGWGDGELIRNLAEDVFIRQKNVLIFLFAGEEAAFARSVTGLEAGTWTSGLLRIVPLATVGDCERFVVEQFSTHEAIAALAGFDLVDGHPLTAAAAAVRDQLRQPLLTLLGDRPLSYGNDILDSFTGVVQSAANARQILPAPTLAEMAGFYGTTPVIAIAAGPSLKRHLDTLRRLRDRCILVACDAVYAGLVDAGIDPHFVTPLERTDDILPFFRRTADSRAVFAGLPLCVPQLIAPFGDERCIQLSCGDRVYDWLVPGATHRVNSGMSTGTLAVSVALAISSGPVWLVGHDLARDAGPEAGVQAGASHWEGAAHAANEWRKAKSDGAKPVEGMEDRMVPGNGGGMVTSIAHWDRFRFDIAHTVFLASRAGRMVYNVNAHDRIYARIDHTHAAPLPDPDSLPVLPPLTLPPRVPARYTDFALRARALASDATAFRAWASALRDELHATMAGPAAGWDPQPFAKKFDLAAPVSPGNRQVFSYFLRSALHNANAGAQLRRRTASTARSRWVLLEGMADLCHALSSTVERLQPAMEEISRDHA